MGTSVQGKGIRVPVPKQYILWPQSSPYIGTLGAKVSGQFSKLGSLLLPIGP